MKKLLIGISAGALALATAGIAAEAQMGAGTPPTMTRVEAKAAAEAAFSKLDVNHDGKLDAGDRAARMGMMFDKIDTNHDGSISRDEFMAAHEKMAHGGMGAMAMGGERPDGARAHDHQWRERHDDNDDRDDHEGRHEHRMGHGDRMGPGHGKMGLLMAILHEADPNHTGSVSRDAFVGGALKLFDKADANHDGKVTAQERHAARAAMRKQMRENMGMSGMPMGGMDHDHMGGMAPPAAAK